MSQQNTALPLSPLISICSWSKTRPLWQQDALRRIVSIGILTESDFDELECICRRDHGLLDKDEPQPTPIAFDDSHLTSNATVGGGVSLISISNLTNVNRLLSNQSLTFAPGQNLTIVFSNNGAGKSGYVRVIKKACRSRGKATEILPDIRAKRPVDKASALLVVHENNTEHSIEWKESNPTDHRLSRIFVFDSHCADHYIEEDDGTAFIPFGLDILEKLAKACESLKQRLSKRQSTLDSAIADTKRGWKIVPGTIVGSLLASLTASTDHSTVEAASDWRVENTLRLNELKTLLASNPKVRAQQTRALASRLKAFMDFIRRSVDRLSIENLETIRQSIQEANEASMVAGALAVDQFDGTFLSGTGSDIWSQLWAAAREFSTQQAYPDKPFPNVDLDALCVLCQSPLEGTNRENLRRFDAFVSNTASKIAEVANRRASERVKEITTLPFLMPEWKKVETDFVEISSTCHSTLLDFVMASDKRHEAIKNAVSAQNWSLIPMPPLSPVVELETLLATLEQRAITEESAADPEAQQKLNSEKSELEAREWLHANKQSILHQIDRMRQARSLQSCIDDTNTLAISNKNKELFGKYVTEAFRQRFSSEIKFLELDRIELELQSRAEKGSTRFGVRLAGATNHAVAHVASEGEKRCISLALFLAELAQASDSSALVFDDPVSSLDHERRSRIAERLVIETKTRQVIVFTHDLAFLYDIQYHAKEMAIEIHGRHIDWSAGTPGRCSTEFPWKAQTFKEMMKYLRDRCNRARSTYNSQGEAEYNQLAGQICSEIRAAAEKIVEEVLFAGVVRRHDSQIKMGCLESVGNVQKEDYQAVYSIWRDCSQLTPAHAQSRSNPVTMPHPDRLEGFVKTLTEVVERVKKRGEPETKVLTPSTVLKVSQ